MAKGKSGSTWLTVDSGAVAQWGSAPEAHPERPWNLEGVNVSHASTTAPSHAMLVVGALDVATSSLESASPGDARFEWSASSALDVTHVAVLSCLFDGLDPAALIEPPEEVYNHFTKENVRQTVHDRYVESFESVFQQELVSGKNMLERVMDGEMPEALTLRLPPSFVVRLTEVTDDAIAELATRLQGACATVTRALPFSAAGAQPGLEALVRAARLATARGHDVFFWYPE